LQVKPHFTIHSIHEILQVGIQVSPSFQIQLEFSLCHSLEGQLIYKCPIYRFLKFEFKILNHTQSNGVSWAGTMAENTPTRCHTHVGATCCCRVAVLGPDWGHCACPALASTAHTRPKPAPQPGELCRPCDALARRQAGPLSLPCTLAEERSSWPCYIRWHHLAVKPSTPLCMLRLQIATSAVARTHASSAGHH
jgi:hypothetical protein